MNEKFNPTSLLTMNAVGNLNACIQLSERTFVRFPGKFAADDSDEILMMRLLIESICEFVYGEVWLHIITF